MTLGVGTLPMKAQLIVVQGKPEGKTIPLALPQFKIGRGEGCQLRPNNDQVSREHALFEVTSDSLFLQDLGSRNGTELNGKKLNAHEPTRLKNGEGRAGREGTNKHLFRSTGVVSTACREGDLSQWGIPGTGGGRAPNVVRRGNGQSGSRRGLYDC